MTPRIAIVGMGIESSVYAEHRSGYRDFPVLEGDAVIGRYPFLAEGSELRGTAEWIGVFVTKAIPGGQVLPDVYADFRSRITAGLAALGDLDGIYLDIHGAMSVVGLTDAEGDLIRAIRGVVGTDVLIAAPMDLHGNVSEVLAREVDLPTCYRMAPHEDAWETRERSARDLVRWIRSGERPSRAWVSVPILLAGEQTSTRVEPAHSLYARIPELAAREGVTDAGLWIGYAWADEPRCHASVVVTGNDEAVLTATAEELGRALWAVREEFDFVGPTASLDEGLDAGLSHRAAGGARPYFVSDSGDNPGAGGSGDVTWSLSRILQRADLTGAASPTVYVASVFDTEAFAPGGALADVREGDEIDVTVGARVDARVSGPVRIRGSVQSVHTDPVAGRIVVIRVGGVRAIVTEFRKAYHSTNDFSSIGLDPAEADIIVTKIGYLEPTLYAAARGWTLALTPGPVDQDLARLGHSRIPRPMFPFDTFDRDPELTPRVFRGRDEIGSAS